MNPRILRIASALTIGLLALMGLIVATSAAAQQPPGPQTTIASAAGSANLEVVGHVGGRTDAADVLGDYAYVGEGPRLTILDVTDPAAPQVVGRTDLWSGLVSGVAVAADDGSHTYAYVTVDGGLAVVNVSTPGAPTQVGFVDTSGGHNPVVSGTHVYVPGGGDGVAVVDVSDKSAPQMVGDYSPGGGPVEVAVKGNYLYAAGRGYGKFDIVDISNPEKPRRIEELSWDACDVVIAGDDAYVLASDHLVRVDISDPENPDVKGWQEIGGGVQGRITTRGSYVYVLSDGTEQIHVLDISPPLTPTLKGTFRTWGEGGSNAVGTITARGTGGTNEWLYTANGQRGFRVAALTEQITPTEVSAYDPPGAIGEMAFAGDEVYVADGNALSVLDVSTPDDPQLASTWLTDVEVKDVAVTGTLAALAGGGDGLHLIDISQPLTPTSIITGFNGGELGGRFKAEDVALSGDRAYATEEWDYLHVIDISNPLTPTTDKSYYGPFEESTSLHDVAVTGTTAYLASFEGLAAVDVTTPTAPISVGIAPEVEGEEVLVITGATAVYLGGQDSGLEIVGLADGPKKLSSYAIPDTASSVAVVGDHAYVGSGHLRVVDISQPSAPVEVGNYDERHIWNPVAVTGTHAYFNGYDDDASQSFLGVLDISDPTAPTEAGAYDLPEGVDDIALTDTLALAATESALYLIDVSTPATPTQRGVYTPTFTSSNFSMKVAVQGRYAYLFDDDANLSVLDISDPSDPKKVGSYDGDKFEGTANIDSTVVVRDSLLYVTTDGYLHILNVTDPNNLEKLASKSVAEYGWDSADGVVAVVDDYVYVAANEVLEVFDVSDPHSPRKVGEYAKEVLDMTTRRDYAYLAASGEGLRVLDLSDPANLDELGFYEANGGVVGAVPDGQAIWLADENGGLRQVDVSDPTAPRQISYQDLPVGDEDIVAMGRVSETFYLASSSYGVYAVQAVARNEKVYLPFVVRNESAP